MRLVVSSCRAQVKRPGAIARDQASLASTKLAKLRPGTLLLVLDEATIEDGTLRLRVSWNPKEGLARRPGTGFLDGRRAGGLLDGRREAAQMDPR